MATIDASLGYVPQYQDSDLSFPVTAYKVVEMGLLPSVSWWHRCTSMRSYRDCVLNALRQVGMEHLAETRFGQLSGGQRQRVLIARALVSAPELVLLDEPFNGLDQESRRILIQIIADLKEAGIALLVSTHDPILAQHTCDWAAFVLDGKVHTMGTEEAVETYMEQGARL